MYKQLNQFCTCFLIVQLPNLCQIDYLVFVGEDWVFLNSLEIFNDKVYRAWKKKRVKVFETVFCLLFCGVGEGSSNISSCSDVFTILELDKILASLWCSAHGILREFLFFICRVNVLPMSIVIFWVFLFFVFVISFKLVSGERNLVPLSVVFLSYWIPFPIKRDLF